MLNPVSVRPLSKSTGQSYSKKDSTAKDQKETKENVQGGERYDSEGKTQRRWDYRTRTAPGLRPAPPHFSRGRSRPNRLLPGLRVTLTFGLGHLDRSSRRGILWL